MHFQEYFYLMSLINSFIHPNIISISSRERNTTVSLPLLAVGSSPLDSMISFSYAKIERSSSISLKVNLAGDWCWLFEVEGGLEGDISCGGADLRSYAGGG